jgi:gliding motility-associated-like protein
MKNKLLKTVVASALFLFPAVSFAQNLAPMAVNDTIVMCQHATITIDVQNNDSDPNGDSLTTSIFSGTINGSFLLNNNFAIDYTPNANFVGTDTITYVVCDTGLVKLCDSAVVFITVTALPVADAGPDRTICDGDSVTIGTAAVGGSTYSWSPILGLSSSTSAQPKAHPLLPTTYVLTVTGPPIGCQNKDSVMVSVNPSPTADAGPDKTMCAGDSTTIGTAAVVGNTYSWSPAGGLSSSTVAQPKASVNNTTVYTLTVTTTASGCQKTDAVSVIINKPTADAGPDKIVCTGDSTTIGTVAIAGNTYSWSPSTRLNSDTLAQPTVKPLVTTSYVLTVTNTTYGCIATDDLLVRTPVAKAGSDTTICQGISVTIGNPSVGSTYSWTPAAGLSSTTVAQPIATPDTTTRYILTETIGGCSSKDSVMVTVNPLPLSYTGPDQTMVGGKSVVLGGTTVNGNTYLWTPDNGLSFDNVAQPTASPINTTTYTLTETNSATGCFHSASVTVTVTRPTFEEIEFFNGFSPNNDGANDKWRIPILDFYPDNNVLIINRLGEEIWNGKNYNNGSVMWDGQNMRGMDVPDGTYFYDITYDNVEKRGWVIVKR